MYEILGRSFSRNLESHQLLTYLRERPSDPATRSDIPPGHVLERSAVDDVIAGVACMNYRLVRVGQMGRLLVYGSDTGARVLDKGRKSENVILYVMKSTDICRILCIR